MHLSASSAQPKRIVAKDLPPELAVEWAEWLPVYALWLPFDGAPSMSTPAGGLLLASEQAWSDQELALLVEWVDSWRLAWCAQFKPPAFGFKLWRHKLLKTLRAPVGVPWWRHGPVLWLMASSLVLLTPVRLTVLAPGELVPAKPAVVRAPLDGVVDLFHVQPNQLVKPTPTSSACRCPPHFVLRRRLTR